MGHTIECPKHDRRFDYRTGDFGGAQARAALRIFPVKVEQGRILIDIPD